MTPGEVKVIEAMVGILRAEAPPRPKPIPQADVVRLLRLRQETAEAADAAKKWEAALAAEEQRLQAALRAGAKMEPGPYRLALETEPTWRSVPWKKIVVKELGRAFAERILADTPVGQREILRVFQEVQGDGDRKEG